MNKVTDKLSSLNFAVWILCILFLWLIWGIGLSLYKGYFDVFKDMNNILVRDWFLDPGFDALHLKIWFAGLCVIMMVMGINLVFCTWNRIIRILGNRFSGPVFFMLVVHLIFGLVALGHFGGFMLGFKHGEVSLFKGESFVFEPGRRIEISDMHFMNDPEVLNKSRREIKKGELDYKHNFAEIAVFDKDQLLFKKQIYLMKPIFHGSLQIALKRFLPLKDIKNQTGPLPGIAICISRNPVLKIFLMIYPLMIMGIAVHLFMTWQKPENNNQH